MIDNHLWLVPIGFVIGAYGTLIGAGGGFVLMPILIILYPEENREILTSISLAVVFFNALSGSYAYARMKRIDYKSGLLLSAATVPGAIIGALTTAILPLSLFDEILGIVLVGVSAFLFLSPQRSKEVNKKRHRFNMGRHVVEADGQSYSFSYNPVLGVILSLVVGYVSSRLGIGGGIIHVPALVNLLDFPVHIATATSHFILAIMSLTGTTVHVATGTFSKGLHRTIFLSVGVLTGAQLGAALSNRIIGIWIIRGLAIALCFVGIRIFFSGIMR